MPPSPRNYAGVTALVLDDDPTMRGVARTALRQLGVEDIQQTGNGFDALHLVQRRRVDVVLCDCSMEPMDGMIFLRKLRELPEGAEVPVIMVTANDSVTDARAAKELGVKAWLVKPVTVQGLMDHVAKALTLAPVAVAAPDQLLADLAARYEESLPQEVERIEARVAQITTDFIDNCERLLGLLHRMKGQAGTFDYALLGKLAGVGHDLLREVARDHAACTAHAADIAAFLQLLAQALRLVVTRKFRGDCGEAGARLLAQMQAKREPVLALVTASLAPAAA